MAIAPSVNHPIDCGLATTATFARQFAKQTVANRTADLELFLEYTPITSGSSEAVVVGDINYTRNTFPTSATNVRVSVDYLPERFASIESIQSDNTGILSQSETDPSLFEYQSTGSTPITVVFNTNEKIRKLVTTQTLAESAIQEEFQSFVEGTLGRHIYDQIRQYANDSTSAPSHYPLYSAFNQSSNAYTKNTGHWLAGLDFSGLTVNKTGSGGVTNVTAITPHHAIGVAHYAPSSGDVLYFCDVNNQTVTRTVQSVGFVAGQDCAIVRFNEAIPSTVKKYKTLPSNFKDYLPLNRNAYDISGNVNSFYGGYLPIVVTSHYRWDSDWPLQRSNRFAYFYQVTTMRDSLSGAVMAFVPAWAEPNNFPDYNGQPSGIRGGDSGSPCFFIINNDLVLVHSHTSGGGGTIHPSFLSSIQAKIDELGPSGQTFQTVDLSGFTDFSS